jgi:hypothetical protein
MHGEGPWERATSVCECGEQIGHAVHPTFNFHSFPLSALCIYPQASCKRKLKESRRPSWVRPPHPNPPPRGGREPEKPATKAYCSLPPCGGGLGWGVCRVAVGWIEIHHSGLGRIPMVDLDPPYEADQPRCGMVRTADPTKSPFRSAKHVPCGREAGEQPTGYQASRPVTTFPCTSVRRY